MPQAFDWLWCSDCQDIVRWGQLQEHARAYHPYLYSTISFHAPLEFPGQTPASIAQQLDAADPDR